MAFQSVPNVVAIEVRYTCFLKQVENTLYFKPAETYDAEYLEDLVEAVFNAWATDAMQGLSSDLELIEVYGKGLTNAADIQALYIPAAPEAGGNVSPALPLNNACCIAFNAGLTGRSTRGRIYLPGIPENAVAGNTFVSGAAATYAQNVADAVGAVITAFPTTKHVIVSRVTAGAPRVTGATYDVTSYASTDNEVDSRRSRVK